MAHARAQRPLSLAGSSRCLPASRDLGVKDGLIGTPTAFPDMRSTRPRRNPA